MIASLKRMVPKGGKVFYDLFEISSANTLEMAATFAEMSQLRIDGDEAQSLYHKMEGLEKQNDEIIHRISYELHRIFITPISREDILDLANALDDVSEKLFTTARQLRLLVVEQIGYKLKPLAENLVLCCREISRLMQSLRAKHHDEASRSIQQLRQLSAQSADIYETVLRDLYADNDDFRSFIKKREIYMHLVGAADKSRNVAKYTENILIKNVL